VCIEQRRKSFRAQQWSIARYDDGNLRGPTHFASGHLQGVTGPTLGLLYNRFGSQSFDHGAHFRCLMPDHRQQLPRFQWLTGAHDVFDEGPSARAVQNFRQFGMHARAFTRGKNHDNGIFGGHIVHIVAFHLGFSNQIAGECCIDAKGCQTGPLRRAAKRLYSRYCERR